MKEIIVKAWRRIKLVFDGTKECHAKLDQAVTRATKAVEKANTVIEQRPLVAHSHGK